MLTDFACVLPTERKISHHVLNKEKRRPQLNVMMGSYVPSVFALRVYISMESSVYGVPNGWHMINTYIRTERGTERQR